MDVFSYLSSDQASVISKVYDVDRKVFREKDDLFVWKWLQFCSVFIVCEAVGSVSTFKC